MQKGFASILALLAAIIGLSFTQGMFQEQDSFQTAIQSMAEAEQNNFLRSVLEQNTDAVIEKTLQNQLENEEINPLIINALIAQNLFYFFQETESQNPEIRFFFG